MAAAFISGQEQSFAINAIMRRHVSTSGSTEIVVKRARLEEMEKCFLNGHIGDVLRGTGSRNMVSLLVCSLLDEFCPKMSMSD